MSEPHLVFYSDDYRGGYRGRSIYRRKNKPIMLHKLSSDGGTVAVLTFTQGNTWYVEVDGDSADEWEAILYQDGGSVIQRGPRVGGTHPDRDGWHVCLIARETFARKKSDPTKYYIGSWTRVDREDHQYEGRAWAVRTERGLPRDATVRVKHRDGNHTTVMLKGPPTRTEGAYALYYKYTKLEKSDEIKVNPAISIPFPSSEETFRKDLRDNIRTLIHSDSTQPQETDMTGQQSKGKNFVDNAIERVTSVDLKNPIVLLGIAYVAYSLLSEEEQAGLQEFLGGKVSKIRSIVALLTA